MLRHGPCWLGRGTALHIVFPTFLSEIALWHSMSLSEGGGLMLGLKHPILHNVVIIVDGWGRHRASGSTWSLGQSYMNILAPVSSVVLRVKSLGVGIASMSCPARLTWQVKIEGVREPEDSCADTSQQIRNTINTAALAHTCRCVVLISRHLQRRVPHMGPCRTCQHHFIRSGNCVCVCPPNSSSAFGQQSTHLLTFLTDPEGLKLYRS